jgi:hypothetical protein
MTDPMARSDINIRSARYFIARTEAICWHCRASTAMFAVGLPPGHEALVLDENAQDLRGSIFRRHESRLRRRWPFIS